MRFNVDIERDFDGVRIVKRLVGIDGPERLAVHVEEESLPGVLLRFDVSDYDVVAEARRASEA